jgi:4-amino-4-deoxy-L-arabinose transferase-like glycosyltransferase
MPRGPPPPFRPQVDRLIVNNQALETAGLVALVVLLGLLVAVVAAWPALPVDETRYLTVAWEMRSSGDWILPTLNFEPYSHKPPLLFWLINASWSVFGVAVWPARLVGVAAMSATLLLTHRLDRLLAPDPCRGPAASALMLASLPVFVMLGFSIMFDMLLTATVTGAQLALWCAGRRGDGRAFVAFGMCAGLGLLAKGPIVFLFTLPAALLGPLWIGGEHKRGWYLRVGAAVALAISIGLCWAMSAAYLGGPEFAEMLFWKQSAGRISSSFAHARPWWFYAPIVLLLLAPLAPWRPAWAGLAKGLAAPDAARTFLLCSIVPALLGLSAISGKQLHYLLPALPAIALLISLGLRKVQPRKRDALPLLLSVGAIVLGLTAFALGGRHFVRSDSVILAALPAHNMPLLIATGVVALGVLALSVSTVRRTLTGLAVANFVFLLGVATLGRAQVNDQYDLQPVATVLSQRREGPIATTQKTHGEFGFLARLSQPVVYVPPETLGAWLADHPSGIAIVPSHLRSRTSIPPQGPVIYSRSYRANEVISLVTGSRQ